MRPLCWLLLGIGLAVPGSGFAESRIEQLRAEAAKAQQAESYEDQARAAELIAFAEALDPAQDGYFDADIRPKAKALREACAAMDHAACTELAHLYNRGQNTWQDQALARSIAIITCESGDLSACDLLAISEAGWIYSYSGRNPAAQAFTESCAAENAEHCHRLAFLQSEADQRGALLDLACEMGHPFSCSLRKNSQGILAAYSKQCDAGDPEGCEGLAHQYAWGRHVQQDYAKAVRLSQRACDAGLAKSCQRLADAYWAGNGIAADPARALKLQEKACRLAPFQCWVLAQRYDAGNGVAQSADRARHFAQMACPKRRPTGAACKFLQELEAEAMQIFAPDLDTFFPVASRADVTAAREQCGSSNGDACRSLARMMVWIKTEAEPTFDDLVVRRASQRVYRIACGLGDQSSCVTVALKALTENDAKEAKAKRDCKNGNWRSCSALESMPNVTDAIAALRKACAANEGAACAALVRRDKDRDDASRLSDLEHACSKGMGEPCRVLGELLQKDRNASRFYDLTVQTTDHKRALEFFAKGCDLGDGRACYWMWLSVSPEGKYDPYAHIPKDAAQALAYRERSCELGDVSSCEMLAYDHQGSEGRDADPEKVLHYARIACRHGYCQPLRKAEQRAYFAELSRDHGPLQAALREEYHVIFHSARAYVRRVRRACRSGDMSGCVRLGSILDGGSRDRSIFVQDVWPRDWSVALYLHACDGGSAEGCFRYGDMFRYGYHNDDAIAAEYVSRACQMGYALACE